MFRDDDAARADLVAALERDARLAEERAERLRVRVEELEAENRLLRAELVKRPDPPAEPAPAETVYLDAKLELYIHNIIVATRDQKHAESVLSGALRIDQDRIQSAARVLAAKAGRPYVIPKDVKEAAADILPGRIVMRDGTPDAVVATILDEVEVP